MCWGYLGIIQGIVYWGGIGIMEKKTETTIVGLLRSLTLPPSMVVSEV